MERTRVYLDIPKYEPALEKLTDVRGRARCWKACSGEEDHLKRTVRRDALQVHFENEIEASG